jgi:alpha-ribazole phosphatase
MEVYLVRHTETVCQKEYAMDKLTIEILEPFLPIFENKKQLPDDAILFESFN